MRLAFTTKININMHKKNILLILFLLLNVNLAFSQDYYEQDLNMLISTENTILNIHVQKKSFFNKMTMGIKGGVNFSLVIPLNNNSIFSGTDNSKKTYNPFYQNIAYQMGFVLRYSFSKAIKLSLQPAINEYAYRYSTEYTWTGTTNLNYLLEYKQSMRFFELPIIVGYYFKADKWQSYVQAGGYYTMLMNSNSHTNITETLDNQVLNSSSTVNSNGIYSKNQFGIIAGVGIRYAAGRTMIGFEANYRLLLSKLSSTSSRYANTQVIGNYNISDDVLFNNIAFTINVSVPLVCDDKNGPYIFCGSN